MRSDYLDTSNPHRLLAFFKYCDCANMAANYSMKIADDESVRLDPATRCLATLMAANKELAIRCALELFSPLPIR